MGIDIRYQNNPSGSNPNVYRIYSSDYFDCTGAATVPLPGPAQSPLFSFNTSCSLTPTSLGQPVLISYTEITPICPSTTTQCTDPNATIDGYLESRYYQDYDFSNFPAGCMVEIQHGSCCRNNVITSLTNPGGDGFWATATLIINPVTPNTSPRFLNPPVLYMCLGMNSQYIHGTVEPDGDSLSYALINCYSTQNNIVSYGPGYSATVPLGPSNPLSINPTTGTLSIHATTQEIGVICIEVSEYRNSQLISRATRDIQVQILNCNNGNNSPVIGDMNGVPGMVIDTIDCTQTGPFQYQFTISDPDIGQNLTANWSQNIPGATMTFTGSGNSLTAQLDFQFLSSGVYNFTIEAHDDACQINAYSAKDFTLKVSAHSTITGTIYDSNNNPVPGCRLYAIYHDPVLQTLSAMDSFYADAQGNYSYGSCESIVHLKATPDSSVYPNELPTYHQTSVLFSSSNPINCLGGTYPGNDIHLASGPNPGGLGFIGGFISQGANKTAATPVVNMPVFLVHASMLIPFEYTITDAQGYFSFNNLGADNYAFWVDHPLTDNLQSPIVALSSGEIKDSLLFELTPLLLILEQEQTGNLKETIFNSLELFPNPGIDEFTISTEIEIKLIQVFTSEGKAISIKSELSNNNKILVKINEAIPAGTYFIRIQDPQGKYHYTKWLKAK